METHTFVSGEHDSELSNENAVDGAWAAWAWAPYNLLAATPALPLAETETVVALRSRAVAKLILPRYSNRLTGWA